MTEHPRSTWRTPPWLFELLDQEFHFDLDAAADAENALCARYFDREKDAFSRAWPGRVFCNPPHSGARYGEAPIQDWVEQAYREALSNADVVAMVLPADTGTRWFRYCVNTAEQIRLVSPRIQFIAPEGIGHSGNRGPTCIVIWSTACRSPEGTAPWIRSWYVGDAMADAEEANDDD